MNLEHGKLSELEKYLAIYKRAREFMISTGNKDQWKDSYPSKEMIINDINNSVFYVLKDEEDIVAIFALIKGIDKTYIHIYEAIGLMIQLIIRFIDLHLLLIKNMLFTKQ